MFVVGPKVGAIDNRYRILPRRHYKIIIVYNVGGVQKTHEIQTDKKGRVKFTFAKQVLQNDFIKADLPDAAPIKLFVFDGNEMRLLHKFKNYGQMVEDRKRNEYRLYEMFQIVFKDLPLVEDDDDEDEDDDDDEEEEEDEEDDEEEEEEEEEDKRKPKKKAFGFLKKMFKKKRH
ncbi:hypothetical protein niasHS_008836 [Heterodera schachtii]|uniref:Uncharacterized protein n=1 Tax=Heterodera schachtii TaxID=97005 RepID=A0ABD2IVK8_HETSC